MFFLGQKTCGKNTQLGKNSKTSSYGKALHLNCVSSGLCGLLFQKNFPNRSSFLVGGWTNPFEKY